MERRAGHPTAPSITRIHDLPDECLIEIFAHIGNPLLPISKAKGPIHLLPLQESPLTHPLQCMYICKQWAKIADSAVRSLALRPDDSLTRLLSRDHIQTLATRFNNLTALTLSWSWPGGPPDGLELLAPRLHTLELPPDETHSIRSPHLSILEASPNIRSLTATLGRLPACPSPPPLPESAEIAWLDALCGLPRLTDLTLTYRGSNFALLWARLGSITGLQNLHLTSRSFPPADPAGRLPTILRSLDWTGGEADERFAVGHLTGLRSLTVRDYWWPDESLGRLSSLTSLAVENVSGMKKRNPIQPPPERLRRPAGYLPFVHCDFELPEAVGSLRSLRALRVDGVKFLPRSLTESTSLRSLCISGRATALPDWIGELRQLREFKLFGCLFLTTLPESLGDLAALRELEITKCHLRTLPESVGSLTRLETCKLDLPRLETLPGSIGSWRNLERLELKCPSISLLPDSLCELGLLQVLTLRNCCGLASLPEEIGRLSKLSRLELHGCRSLRSVPDSIGGLGNLRSLKVERCGRMEYLPTTFGGLTGLTELSVAYSVVELPEAVKELPRLGALRCPRHLLPAGVDVPWDEYPVDDEDECAEFDDGIDYHQRWPYY